MAAGEEPILVRWEKGAACETRLLGGGGTLAEDGGGPDGQLMLELYPDLNRATPALAGVESTRELGELFQVGLPPLVLRTATVTDTPRELLEPIPSTTCPRPLPSLVRQ